MRRHLIALAVVSLSNLGTARADETQVLPRGTFLLDMQYLHSHLDKRWGGNHQALPLIDPVKMYDPGNGYQGTVTAQPLVSYDWLVPQIFYGLTDQLTVGAVVPIVLRTHITTNLGWASGDYINQLGRPYSETDFWQWAASMGQPSPPSNWYGNRWTLGDILLAARWQVARNHWMEQFGLTAAASLTVTLPTGQNADPEQLVAAGTNAWEVNAYGDVEPHIAINKTLYRDQGGFERVSMGIDVLYAWFRPRTFTTPRGTVNPLLLQYQPYVGDTYVIKGGDWFGTTLVADVALLLGPTFATAVSSGSLERAEELPALIALTGSYTYIRTAQTWWRSNSPLWDYQREQEWQPGEKNIVSATLTISLLRLGLPFQIYGVWRSQEIFPGVYTRAAGSVGGGIRVLGKFW
jgi:hypothetical protein